MMDVQIEELYRVSIPDDGSSYWRITELAEDGIHLSRIGAQQTMIVGFDDVIVAATNMANIGKQVAFTPFSR